jgi:MYXO-CTERM domain-containing protein
MTNYNKDRGFRKGTLAAAPGANWAIMGFASTVDNNNNPQHYVRIIDENSKWLTERIKINQRPNANHGASQIMFAGMDGSDYIFVENDCNNGDTQDIYILAVSTTGGTPAVTVRHRVTLFESNIARGHCVNTGTLQVTCVTAVGSNRPPEVGVGAAVVDVKLGKIIKKAIVAKSQPNQRIYANQPTIVALPNNRIALMHTLSKGRGTDGNKKVAGAAERAIVMTLDGTTLAEIDKTSSDTSVIPFARHSHLFHATTATDGTTYLGALSGSPTSAGPAGARMLHIDPAGKITVHADTLPVANNADTQYWTRLGNNNPNNQGRSYLTALTQVKNPGFGLPNGWMPEASAFTVVPTSHFDAASVTDPKVRNSAYLNFVPIETALDVKISLSGVVDTGSIPPGASPRVQDNGDPTGTGSGTPFGPHENANGVSCSVGQVGGSGGGLAGFGLLGVALALSTIRRNKKA